MTAMTAAVPLVLSLAIAWSSVQHVISDKHADSAALCRERMDLLFILDHSSSISPQQFKQMLWFVGEIIESQNVAQNQTHVSVSIYARKSHQHFCFQDYTNKTELLEIIGTVSCRKCKPRQTATGTALRHARLHTFTQACQVRDQQSVPWVTILVTDGKSTEIPKNGFPEGWLREQAGLLSELHGAYVISVGVGRTMKPGTRGFKELRVISDKVFSTTSFEGLKDVLDDVRHETCETAQKGPKKTYDRDDSCDEKLDVVLMLDKSGSVGDDHWRLARAFASNIVQRLMNTNMSASVAASIIARKVHPVFCFNDYDNLKNAKRAIDNLECNKCREQATVIGEGLQDARERILTADCGHRPDAKALVILITDAKSTEVEYYWLQQAELLKDKRVMIAAVETGKDVLSHNLAQLASEPSLDTHYMNSESLVRRLGKKVKCSKFGDGMCEKNWYYNPITKNCDRYFPTKLSCSQIAGACSIYGAKVAAPRSRVEQIFLKELSLGSNSKMWIGLNYDEYDNKWEWDSHPKQLDWTYWRQGQPKAGRAGQAVGAAMQGAWAGRWLVRPCHELHAYACTMPALTS